MGVCPSEVKDDSSDCLGIDPTQHAVLMLQTQHDGGGHVFMSTTSRCSATVPQTTADKEACSAQVLLISQNLRSRDNVLHVESRTDSGGTSGDIDDLSSTTSISSTRPASSRPWCSSLAQP